MGAVAGAAAMAALLLTWPRIERYFFDRFAAYQEANARTRNALSVQATRELADAELAEFARLRQQFQQAGEVLDEQIARREHVLAGGEIDDSPRKWRKGETSKA